jgi:hypothetical protein
MLCTRIGTMEGYSHKLTCRYLLNTLMRYLWPSSLHTFADASKTLW